MKLIKQIICGVLLLLLFYACQPESNKEYSQPSDNRSMNELKTASTDFERIEAFFFNEFGYELTQAIQALIVLNSDGDCMNCNASYSRFVERFVDDTTVLFLVCTPGNKFDVSFFLGKENNRNVFLDFSNHFAALNLLQKSGAIFLNKGEIDEVLAISAKTLSENFDRLTQRIDSVRTDN